MLDPAGESAGAAFLLNLMLVLFAGLAVGGLIALAFIVARAYREYRQAARRIAQVRREPVDTGWPYES